MLKTKTRDKAGTTTYVAQAYYVIELDDPEAIGNGGLTGLDEDSERREDFPTQKAAVAWLRRQIKANPDRLWQNAIVDEHQWEAAEYEWDERGETVLDAFDNITHEWTYWIGTTKTLELQWDDEVRS